MKNKFFLLFATLFIATFALAQNNSSASKNKQDPAASISKDIKRVISLDIVMVKDFSFKGNKYKLAFSGGGDLVFNVYLIPDGFTPFAKYHYPPIVKILIYHNLNDDSRSFCGLVVEQRFYDKEYKEHIADKVSEIVVPDEIAQMVIDMMAGEGWNNKTNIKFYETPDPNKYPEEYTNYEHNSVDLGLPSGTLWADCNVGAEKPEEYGKYYAWGEHESKDYYAWTTYLEKIDAEMEDDVDCGTDKDPMKKYVFPNVKSIAGTPFDVAHDWGFRWSLPTKEQWEELENKCKWTWTKRNGVDGCIVTGPNNNSIFLPAAGKYTGTKLEGDEVSGGYWSATPFGGDSYNAICWSFIEDKIIWFGQLRYRGLSVRPVKAKTKQRKHMEFLGIPIDGTKEQFAKKLIERGFKYDPEIEGYTGSFLGINPSHVHISTSEKNNKVKSVSVYCSYVNDNIYDYLNYTYSPFYSHYVGHDIRHTDEGTVDIGHDYGYDVYTIEFEDWLNSNDF